MIMRVRLSKMNRARRGLWFRSTALPGLLEMLSLAGGLTLTNGELTQDSQFSLVTQFSASIPVLTPPRLDMETRTATRVAAQPLNHWEQSVSLPFPGTFLFGVTPRAAFRSLPIILPRTLEEAVVRLMDQEVHPMDQE